MTVIKVPLNNKPRIILKTFSNLKNLKLDLIENKCKLKSEYCNVVNNNTTTFPDESEVARILLSIPQNNPPNLQQIIPETPQPTNIITETQQPTTTTNQQQPQQNDNDDDDDDIESDIQSINDQVHYNESIDDNDDDIVSSIQDIHEEEEEDISEDEEEEEEDDEPEIKTTNIKINNISSENQQEREDVLMNLKMYESRGFKVPSYQDQYTPLPELNRIWRLVKREHNINHSISSSKFILGCGMTGLEFLCCEFLGIDLSGFADSQINNMAEYELALYELSNRSYMRWSTDSGPEMQIAYMIGRNAVLYNLAKRSGFNYI